MMSYEKLIKIKYKLFKNYSIDAKGREFRDALTYFMRSYFERIGGVFDVPIPEGQHFFNGFSGVTIFRNGPFQIQLFLAEPDVYIPPHVHPDVDSYEVFLRGMEFYHEGDTVISMDQAFMMGNNDKPLYSGGIIRVKPDESHGGLSSSTGGAFLSVQHWKNNIDVSSVHKNWSGKTLGELHDRQII